MAKVHGTGARDRAETRELGDSLRRLVVLGSMVVATIYPHAVAARLVVALPGDTVSRIRLRTGVPAGPRARSLMPVIGRMARRWYPDAEAVAVVATLPDGQDAWLPISSSPGAAGAS